MNENVVKILTDNLWHVATTNDEEVNVAPMGFKTITPDEKLLIGDIFMETTVNNVKANGKISISACDAKTGEGYQVKGTAVYVNEGPVLDSMVEAAKKVFKDPVVVRGVVVITPTKVIVTTPGPDNKKEL